MDLAILRQRIHAIEWGEHAAYNSSSPAATQSLLTFGVDAIDAALPWGGLPLASLHEVVASEAQQASFCAALLGRMKSMGHAGGIVWCSKQPLYTLGLHEFGLSPEQFIFVEPGNTKEGLWVLEEALTAQGLMAVVGEGLPLTPQIGRRLQLAAKQSGVVAFLLLDAQSRHSEHVAVTRWQVQPLPSAKAPGRFVDDGVGPKRFLLELMRCRGALVPQHWSVEWNAGNLSFNLFSEQARSGATGTARAVG
jgi:protein ImuA